MFIANVAVISYVGVQIFQQLYNCIFQDTTNSITHFGTKQFQLLPSIHLLTRLIGKTAHSQNNNLEIVPDDLQVFRMLCNKSKKSKVAMKSFGQQGKNKAAQELGTWVQGMVSHSPACMFVSAK